MSRAKPGQHAHHGLHLAAIEQRLDIVFTLRRGGDLKAAGSLESGQQIAALRRAVQIHPGDADVIHIQVDRVAEDDQLNQRRQEQQHAHARLPQRLPEFLAHDDPDPCPHTELHASFCLQTFCVASTNTIAA